MIRLFYLILLLAFVIGAYFYISRVTVLENYLSRQLKVVVKIEDVQVGWNVIKLKGFSVENPSKSSSPFILSVDSIWINTDFLQLLTSKKKIYEIDFYHPVFMIELYNYSGSSNNLARFLNSISLHSENALFSIDRICVYDFEFSVEKYNGKPLSTKPFIAYLEVEPHGVSALGACMRYVFEVMAEQVTQPKSLLNDVLPGKAEGSVKRVEKNS